MSTPSGSFPAIDCTSIGPRVGARFPDILLPDQHGVVLDLHAARGERRALVLFVRSARWWPFCKTQLVELQRSLPDFERNGIAVFALSYDPVEVLARFGATHQITYPLLSDEGSTVITALGLLNEQVYEHHAFYGVARQEHHWGVPYPGAFLLDAQGVVTEKRFQDSYRMRETGVALLERGFGTASTIHGSEVIASAPGVTLRAYLDADVYRAYQRLRLTLELAIAAGLHVYGQPIPDGYIPLAVEVDPVEGLIVDSLEGPEPHPFRVGGLDEPFVVYDGLVRFSLPLTFVQKVGDRVLRVTIRWQACSATDCLPPSSLALRIPVAEQDNVEARR